MITSIVRDVQRMLATPGATGLEVEIVFPVASEAVARTDDAELSVVPGVAGGEGCSTAGGCATCPFMKMNSLDALFDVIDEHARGAHGLSRFHPRIYAERVDGKTVAELGSEPILHMRHFGRSGALSDALVADVIGRRGAA
jgi:quinolinate synthase